MEDEIMQLPETDVEVVDIQFRPGQKVYYFDPDGLKLEVGDHVIINTARGAEFGICAGTNHTIAPKDVVAPLRKVLRKATAQDEKIVAENRAKEQRAYEVCLQKIQAHGLDMQLVSAEVAFDGSKILFYFTADERVDFRELVKNLASVFHTRIELRQIGVRDKAKMVGGLGICGRPFCCATFLDDFQPVSIKMAKTQNLSLNPTKISGTCGRLMCCLKYEQDAYEDLIRNSPKMDSFVDTPEGRGTIVEINLLRQSVKVRMEENPETVSVFPNADIAVLRSGKAKKNDPPIPADLAPISGSGKRTRKEKEEDSLRLEPIRFRYSTETVVDEPAVEEVPQLDKENKPSRARNRRRKPHGKTGPKPETEAAAPKEEKKPAQMPKEPRPPKEPKAAKEPREPGEGKEGKPAGERRRRPPRRNRGPKPEGNGPQTPQN